MLPSGEYPQPNVRRTNLKIPVVAGYTTGRLRAQWDAIPLASPGQTTNYVMAEIHNRSAGTTAGTVVLQFNAATNISSSGARTPIGSPISIVRGGQTSVFFEITQPYIEVACVSATGQNQAGEVDIQISSQIKFDDIDFLRSEAIYPQQLWAAPFQYTVPPIVNNSYISD